MVIYWLGQSCFKIHTEQKTIVIDPFDKSIGLKEPSCAADLVLSTHNHRDHNNVSCISGNPFIIEGPGEYEYKGVSVLGIDSYHDDKKGEERGKNTMYFLKSEDIGVAHLGDLGQSELTEEQLSSLSETDILFIPIGGVYTIAAKEALNIVNQIQPKIVVPMHYLIPSLNIDLQTADSFLEGMGVSGIEKSEKLSLKKKDLAEEGRIETVALKPYVV